MATFPLFTPACADEDEMAMALLNGLIEEPAAPAGNGGMVVYHWSDGLSYSDESGSPLDTNPWTLMDLVNNSGIWIIIGVPGGAGPQWMFQKLGTGSWDVKRSAIPFADGTPDATTPLTSVISDAVVTGAALFPAGPLGILTSIEDSDGYGWTAFGIPPGGGNVKFILFGETLQAGTHSATDNDPYVRGFYNDGTGFASGAFRASLDDGMHINKRYRHAKGGAANTRVMYEVTVAAHTGGSNPQIVPAVNTTNQQVGREPEDDTEVPRFIPVSKNGANSLNSGFCGHPRRQRFATCGGHANGQVMSDGNPDGYWIYMAGVWVQWTSYEPAV